MTTLTFTPKEFDDTVDTALLSFVEQVKNHLPCICKKKMHKNCVRHNALNVMKMVFDQRAPIGDKILYLQSKKSPDGLHNTFDTVQPKQSLLEDCKVVIKPPTPPPTIILP